MIRTFKRTFLLGAFLFPVAVFAATFTGPLATTKSVSLQAAIQVGGITIKSPATVPAGSDFSVVWRSTGAGCVSNWNDSTLSASGSTVGSITASRSFVITCFGRGTAQTAAMQVNVGVLDLSVSTFSFSGLKKGKGSGTYVEGPFGIKTTVKNLGKLPTATTFKVKYTYAKSADMRTGLITMGEINLHGINGGESTGMEEFPWTGAPSGNDSIYYQVCADTGNAVAEVKEDNNCSKVLGPFKFVAKPS